MHKSPGFRLPVRVYIEDTDAGGIVYYVNYLKFMERARTEWLRSLGFQHYTLLQDDFLFVVHRAEVDYCRPARIDDELVVTVAVEKAGRASLLFRQQVVRVAGEKTRVDAKAGAEGLVLAEGLIKVACVSRQQMAPRAMPDAIAAAVRKWCAGAA